MDLVDDYIWGKVDETEYLQNIVANDSIHAESLLSKIETIQRSLNTQLRQGVEENYPRLLEQVSAIEALDVMQVHFDDEMQLASRCAEQLANYFSDYYKHLNCDVIAIENLTKLNRILVDGLRCDELIKNWNNENELIRRAEVVHELNSLLKTNEKLRNVKWFSDNLLFKITELSAKTHSSIIEQLKEALSSLNSSTVTLCLKSLNLIYEDQPQTIKKELSQIMDEAIRELNSLFIQLNGVGTSSVSGSGDKTVKLLPQLGNKLHLFLEQYQLLGLENAQSFARSVGKIIVARVSANAPFALKLLQTLYKCLITHPDAISKLIRDSLSSLKVSILSQSLSNLFAAVDDVFAQDDKKGSLIVEKLNFAMKTELQNVNWDSELLKEMEISIAKTLRYISSKVESQIHINEETLQLSGRVNRQQAATYQMLTVAHNFIKHWPYLSQSLTAIIESNIDALLNKMKLTVSIVLDSMYKEDMTAALSLNALSSFYMKELCNHLKVFRVHVFQIEPLTESVEALPNFLNYVIEQLLLNISLILFSKASTDRFIKDLEYLCRMGLQPFNCKTSKLLNSYLNIADFLRLAGEAVFLSDNFQDEVKKVSGLSSKASSIIPTWLVVHILINVSRGEILLPHDSVGWSREDYIKWFNEHSESDRFKFFQNLMTSYRQSVIARNATEFVKFYPLINEIIDKVLPNSV